MTIIDKQYLILGHDLCRGEVVSSEREAEGADEGEERRGEEEEARDV